MTKKKGRLGCSWNLMMADSPATISMKRPESTSKVGRSQPSQQRKPQPVLNFKLKTSKPPQKRTSKPSHENDHPTHHSLNFPIIILNASRSPCLIVRRRRVRITKGRSAHLCSLGATSLRAAQSNPQKPQKQNLRKAQTRVGAPGGQSLQRIGYQISRKVHTTFRDRARQGSACRPSTLQEQFLMRQFLERQIDSHQHLRDRITKINKLQSCFSVVLLLSVRRQRVGSFCNKGIYQELEPV